MAGCRAISSPACPTARSMIVRRDSCCAWLGSGRLLAVAAAAVGDGGGSGGPRCPRSHRPLSQGRMHLRILAPGAQGQQVVRGRHPSVCCARLSKGHGCNAVGLLAQEVARQEWLAHRCSTPQQRVILWEAV